MTYLNQRRSMVFAASLLALGVLANIASASVTHSQTSTQQSGAGENEALRTSRLSLCGIALRELETLLSLLGIEVPKRM